MSASAAPRFDPARRRAVTIALLLVTALASFESTVVSTAMPTIIGELHGLPLYTWVFSIYLLASTITMPIYGRLADVYGRRRVLMSATVVFLAGAVTCAFARSMPQLIVARGLQGLGAGGLIPIALTVTGDLYSLEERARVQAFFSSVWGFASLVGPLLGAFMTVTFGWRSIFTINVPLGLVALFLVATKMIESRKPGSDPLDVAGALTLALGIGALLFAVLQRAGAGALGTGARLFLGVLGVTSPVTPGDCPASGRTYAGWELGQIACAGRAHAPRPERATNSQRVRFRYKTRLPAAMCRPTPTAGKLGKKRRGGHA